MVFKIAKRTYSLDRYGRSNQETCLDHRPSVVEGTWVQKGDLLADSAATVCGDVSLGKNILVAYMPWEGYNFEDAILISERLVSEDLFTSLHIERYEIEARETKYGHEQITKQIYEKGTGHHLKHLEGQPSKKNKKAADSKPSLSSGKNQPTEQDSNLQPSEKRGSFWKQSTKKGLQPVFLHTKKSPTSRCLMQNLQAINKNLFFNQKGFKISFHRVPCYPTLLKGERLYPFRVSYKHCYFKLSSFDQRLATNQHIESMFATQIKGFDGHPRPARGLKDCTSKSVSNKVQASERTDKGTQPSQRFKRGAKPCSPVSYQTFTTSYPKRFSEGPFSEKVDYGVYMNGAFCGQKSSPFLAISNGENKFSAKSLPSFLSFKKKKLKEQPDCSQNENQALSLRRGKTWSNVGSSEEPFSFLCSRVGKSKSLFYIKLMPLPFQGITKQLKKRGSMATPGQRGGQNGTAPSLKEVAPKGSSFGATNWSESMFNPLLKNHGPARTEVVSFKEKERVFSLQSDIYRHRKERVVWRGLERGVGSEDRVEHLDRNGVIKIGVWVKHRDILVGKVTPLPKRELSPHEKLLYTLLGRKPPTVNETSLRVPKGVEGRVVGVEVLSKENSSSVSQTTEPASVQIYIAVKRKIQVGDKMAGRHGNKGIVSKIMARQDMPYLPDGTPIDIILNPLGVPSRMNVGQVFECMLGLAGRFLKEQFRVAPFDELAGPEASRSLVYSKLFEASYKTGYKWLFEPYYPGKTKLFDGRTGETFHQPITVGQAYILKLIHLVDDKVHARSVGPYSLITQQPVRGRSKHGGQRVGEMEVWALEGFGAAYTLQEVLTIKSDDISGRGQVLNCILNDQQFSFGTPDVFRMLIRELRALCLNVTVNKQVLLD